MDPYPFTTSLGTSSSREPESTPRMPITRSNGVPSPTQRFAALCGIRGPVPG